MTLNYSSNKNYILMFTLLLTLCGMSFAGNDKPKTPYCPNPPKHNPKPPVKPPTPTPKPSNPSSTSTSNSSASAAANASAAATAKQSQGQQQGQTQGQTSNQTNDQANQQSTNISSVDASNNSVNIPHQAPMTIIADPFPTAPCRIGMSAGGSWLTGSLGLAGSTKDGECDSRAAAAEFLYYGNTRAGGKILCNLEASKKSGLTAEDCAAFRDPTPDVPVVVAPPSVIVNMPPSPVTSSAISTTEVRPAPQSVGTVSKVDNKTKALLDDAILYLNQHPGSQFVMYGGPKTESTTSGIEYYLVHNHIDQSRIVPNLTTSSNKSVSMVIEPKE